MEKLRIREDMDEGLKKIFKEMEPIPNRQKKNLSIDEIIYLTIN